jgi:hypothetical protein
VSDSPRSTRASTRPPSLRSSRTVTSAMSHRITGETGGQRTPSGSAVEDRAHVLEQDEQVVRVGWRLHGDPDPTSVSTSVRGKLAESPYPRIITPVLLHGPHTRHPPRRLRHHGPNR